MEAVGTTTRKGYEPSGAYLLGVQWALDYGAEDIGTGVGWPDRTDAARRPRHRRRALPPRGRLVPPNHGQTALPLTDDETKFSHWFNEHHSHYAEDDPYSPGEAAECLIQDEFEGKTFETAGVGYAGVVESSAKEAR